MSRITVVVENGLVGLDNLFVFNVDVSSVPSNVHALQWDDTKGELEFNTLEDGTKPVNEGLTELPSWVETCLVKRQEKMDADEAKRQAELALLPPILPNSPQA